jgi:hypothetical protein
VAHTCNPSYSGGRDQKDCGSKPIFTPCFLVTQNLVYFHADTQTDSSFGPFHRVLPNKQIGPKSVKVVPSEEAGIETILQVWGTKHVIFMCNVLFLKNNAKKDSETKRIKYLNFYMYPCMQACHVVIPSSLGSFVAFLISLF